MYYRMSTYKIYPGKEEEFIAMADRLRPEMKAIPGNPFRRQVGSGHTLPFSARSHVLRYQR